VPAGWFAIISFTLMASKRIRFLRGARVYRRAATCGIRCCAYPYPRQRYPAMRNIRLPLEYTRGARSQRMPPSLRYHYSRRIETRHSVPKHRLPTRASRAICDCLAEQQLIVPICKCMQECKSQSTAFGVHIRKFRKPEIGISGVRGRMLAKEIHVSTRDEGFGISLLYWQFAR